MTLTAPNTERTGPPTGDSAPPTAAVAMEHPPPEAVRIELPGYDLAAALALERELGVSHVLSQVLVRRGHGDADSARALLAADDRHSPACFDGIERAVELVGGHIRRGSRIVVHGDYDVDGVCATAVMVRALRALGADPQWYLPSRSEDGYGLATSTLERLAARGTDLLITVDCGVSAVEQVRWAREAGIDVLVTDHHMPRADGALPDCELLHPRLCDYPCPDLCGAAVAHKLAEALGAASAEDDLEFVALATVADLVALRGENRRLVRAGLAQMAASARPGIRALLAVSRSDPSALDASCLGFRLAPRINAAGRLRRADAALELLLTDDAGRAREIAAELDRLNAERRSIEQRIGWEAESLAAAMGERSAYVLAASGWHAGVIGIVASRIAERYHRPAILIALDARDPRGPAQGSGRSIAGFDLLGALDAASAQLLRYGGHRAAAGLSILPARVGAFREAVEAHAARLLTQDLLETRERIDAVASTSELSLALAEELLALEPCGAGNPGARLMIPGARFEDVRTIAGGRHARFTVSSGGARASAVAFGCDGRVEGAGGDSVDASFRLERNSWQGVVEPRLVLRRAAPSHGGEITVLGEPDDYLRAALREAARALPGPGASRCRPRAKGGSRTVLDRRAQSPLAVITDVCAAARELDGALALVVCADAPRRLLGLGGRVGPLCLISHAALAADTQVMDAYRHVVVLDPPSSADSAALMAEGSGFTHLAWGEAELRFAQQMHELEYGLRPSLAALYRALRAPRHASGAELERLLRGDRAPGRPARLAGRLLRVLAELGLVGLDTEPPALTVTGEDRTELSRSPAFRAYQQIYEDGQRFLSRVRPIASN